MSLCELVKDDSSLLNDILIEYTFSIDNNKRDELEDYVNSNINEILH